MKKICVYCGSSKGDKPLYLDAAKQLGAMIAKNDIQLVYGGGKTGLMGMIAKSCLENGGKVVGVISENIIELEVAHDNLTELITVETMHQRKSKMVDISDAFIALPGGIGTMEEAFEVFTWIQLGLIEKPIGFLNINGFFDHLFKFMGHIVNEGFLRNEHLERLIAESDIGILFDKITNYEHMSLGKWFDREEHIIR